MIVLRGKDIEGEREGGREWKCVICVVWKYIVFILRTEKGISLNVKLPYKDQPDYVFN